MKRKIITTGDGSKTIHIPEWNEQYHSKHGALNEALHVFINSGLRYIFESNKYKAINVLEIGFGTGLNAFLTAIEAQKFDVKVNYVGVEAYPVLDDEVSLLNYVEQVDNTKNSLFNKLHEVPWETEHQISSNFNLTKRKQFFADIKEKNRFHLIYYDAFGARVQPELWTKEMFQIMYDALLPNGVLVTYAAIGQVKRDMKEIGFTVERLAGPPGKRHMLRALK